MHNDDRYLLDGVRWRIDVLVEHKDPRTDTCVDSALIYPIEIYTKRHFLDSDSESVDSEETEDDNDVEEESDDDEEEESEDDVNRKGNTRMPLPERYRKPQLVLG
jgi:hypothetical protein